MADCVLCGLVTGQAEVSVVYEDERTMTFMDIQPVVRPQLELDRTASALTDAWPESRR